MKNYLRTMACCLAILTLGCNEDENLKSDPAVMPAQLDANEQVSYAKTNLLTLGNAAIALADDHNFRTALYAQIEKEFDGDKDVLIRDLASTSKNGKVADRFSQN